MKPSIETMLGSLVTENSPSSGFHLLRILESHGLIDERAAEAYYARREVLNLVRRGFGRCRAMEKVAERLCCSFAKVRKILYSKTTAKNNL